MITIIAAIAQNNALGKDNKIIWHLPDDFKHFKEITSGHYIVMGRKTFESFPKPLPNRTHIVISRQKNYAPQGCIVATNLDDAIAKCPTNQDFFIIGGGEIYKQAINLVDKLDITRVHHSFDADVFFPEIDPAIWELQTQVFHTKDEKHLYDFSFETYFRKK